MENVNLESVVCLEFDVPNKNGRIYPKEVVQKIADDLNTRNESGATVFGEFDGTKDGSGTELSIDLARVSHTISNLRVQDGKLIGSVRLLDTPMGNIAKTLLNEVGDTVGFRPRGTGKVGLDGVVTDYNIVTIDLVTNPA